LKHLLAEPGIDLGADDVDASPDDAVEILLRAASEPDLDIDDMASLASAAVAHLQLERFQRHMVAGDVVDVPLTLFVRSYDPSTPRALLTYASPLADLPAAPRRIASEEAELSAMRKSLVQALADVSALAEFAVVHASMDTPLMQAMVRWLAAAPVQLQLCACIMIGNLARDDETSGAMIASHRIHEPLLAILQTSPDTQVLHSAMGFLRNLAILPANKPILGAADAIATLARFWKSETTPLLGHASASLARQLIGGCLANVWRLLASLSPDADSPAHAKTYLSLLLAVFEAHDEPGLKIEIARSVAAILRCAHAAAPATPEDRALAPLVLDRLYALHQRLGRPLAVMVVQARWPIIRSEGWFALALMARSEKGSAVAEALLDQVEVYGALEAAIRGEEAGSPQAGAASSAGGPGPSPEPEAGSGRVPSEGTRGEMQAKDRENAMVLVGELLKHGVGPRFYGVFIPLPFLLRGNARLSSMSVLLLAFFRRGRTASVGAVGCSSC
jgi:hypothetical protein